MFRKFLLASAIIVGGHCVPSPLFTPLAMAQDETVQLTISCNNVFLLGVDVTVDGQSVQIPGGQARVLDVRPNSVVHVSAFACQSCDFNVGNGGNWEIYSPAAFIIASRYLGGQ